MDDLWRRKGWSGLSLARQFALAGGVVMLVATGLVTGFNPLRWLAAMRPGRS